ncbi:MAG: hypothetical protein MI725_15615 [Pirellulales bacterium]|nr:hypothetical protein [Pirellulales bacterium]
MSTTSMLRSHTGRLSPCRQLKSENGYAKKALGALPRNTRWSWACRGIDQSEELGLIESSNLSPTVGDLVVAEVTRIRQHTAIITSSNERLRLYEGDCLVGVLGNRYATDVYEAEVTGVDSLQLLTAGGMIGAVLSKNQNVKSATELKFRGYLSADGRGLANLKHAMFPEIRSTDPCRNVVLVVGAGMNTGKTSTAAKLIKGLLQRGMTVAGCKATGSVSHRDLFELRSAGAIDTKDFSDYGFPSTYMVKETELLQLFETIRTDAQVHEPDVIVIELADGVLQRETAMLLADPEVRENVVGVVLAAPCSLSALAGVDEIERLGQEVLGVSGIITNAPLFVREFNNRSSTPVFSSTGDATELAAHVAEATLKVR